MKNMEKCCRCCGSTPLFHCVCSCHRKEDCSYWETLAFIWICDAPDDMRRQDAWRRFCKAYPEYQSETCEEFWERMLKTFWYKKEGHKHHHRHHHDHDYC
jgi:hypothetical protein